MTPSEWAAVFRRLSDGYRKQLSPQQRLIAKLMLTLPPQHNSNRDIAEALSASRGPGGAGRHIKVSTVDTQVERLFERAGVHSRMELVIRVWHRTVRGAGVDQVTSGIRYPSLDGKKTGHRKRDSGDSARSRPSQG
jgi:DNA-binding CsgD family transcriptional regulator